MSDKYSEEISDPLIAIIRKKVNFQHDSSGGYYDLRETYVIENIAPSPLTEFWVQVEQFRPNLIVNDSDGEELPFLTNDGIIDLHLEVLENIDFKTTFVIYIKLPHNKAIGVKETRIFTLTSRHFEMEKPIETTLTDFVLRRKRVSYQEFFYMHNANNLAIFIEIPEGDQVYAIRIEKRDGNKLLPLNNDEIHVNKTSNSVSFVISRELKTKHNISRVQLIYRIRPSRIDVSLNAPLMYFILSLTVLVIPVLTYGLFLKTTSITQLMSALGADFISIITLALLPFRSRLIEVKKSLRFASIVLLLSVLGLAFDTELPGISDASNIVNLVGSSIEKSLIPTGYILIIGLLFMTATFMLSAFRMRIMRPIYAAIAIVITIIYVDLSDSISSLSSSIPVYYAYVFLALVSILLFLPLRAWFRFR